MFDGLSCDGVSEAQFPGMQLLAGWGVADGGGEAMGGLTAVNLIAKDRVTQMLEMDANLMGSTGEG